MWAPCCFESVILTAGQVQTLDFSLHMFLDFPHNDFQGWRTSIADAQFALGERNNPPDELHSEMGAACVPACVKCKPSCLKQAFQLVLSTN